MKDIWVPISGQIAQQRKVDTIANNIANINTNGFKKDGVVFKEYLTAQQKGIDHIDLPNKDWSPKDFYHTHGAENAKVLIDGSFTDFSQGQLQPTSNPLDLGIQGRGFFTLLSPRGVRYTRNGTFTLNAEGKVVDNLNNKLLLKGQNKELDPEAQTIKIEQGKKLNITQSGSVYLGEKKIGELLITEFKDPHTLKKEGNQFFINENKENIKDSPINSTTHQGFIETSNVNAVGEMANLIKAHRQFENIQKAIQIYDGINGKLINELGNH
jgi:flagellar basal-body rod protein FlgG